jgi:Na+/H+ antiporter NhaB
LPYTIVLTLVGLLSVTYILPGATDYMVEEGIITNLHANELYIETDNSGHH